MKIVIIGNSGSGKTWLSRCLSEILMTPVLHFDDLFWEPGGFDKKRSNTAIEFLIQQSIKRDSWIAEGVFGELAEYHLDIANLLIWLDIEWVVCKERLEKRGSESKRHQGREQSEEGLKRLLEWACHYYDRRDLRSYEGHREMLECFPGQKEHFRSESDVNKFLENIQNNTALDL